MELSDNRISQVAPINGGQSSVLFEVSDQDIVNRESEEEEKEDDEEEDVSALPTIGLQIILDLLPRCTYFLSSSNLSDQVILL